MGRSSAPSALADNVIVVPNPDILLMITHALNCLSFVMPPRMSTPNDRDASIVARETEARASRTPCARRRASARRSCPTATPRARRRAMRPRRRIVGTRHTLRRIVATNDRPRRRRGARCGACASAMGGEHGFVSRASADWARVGCERLEGRMRRRREDREEGSKSAAGRRVDRVAVRGRGWISGGGRRAFVSRGAPGATEGSTAVETTRGGERRRARGGGGAARGHVVAVSRRRR